MAILFHQQSFLFEKLLKTLERESQIATDWFKENNMIVNADTFQAIIVKRNSDMCNQYTLNIDGNQVTSEKSVKLLGLILITNYLSMSTFPHYVKKQVINLTQEADYTDIWGLRKNESSSIVSFMLILITVP